MRTCALVLMTVISGLLHAASISVTVTQDGKPAADAAIHLYFDDWDKPEWKQLKADKQGVATADKLQEGYWSVVTDREKKWLDAQPTVSSRARDVRGARSRDLDAEETWKLSLELQDPNISWVKLKLITTAGMPADTLSETFKVWSAARHEDGGALVFAWVDVSSALIDIGPLPVGKYMASRAYQNRYDPLVRDFTVEAKDSQEVELRFEFGQVKGKVARGTQDGSRKLEVRAHEVSTWNGWPVTTVLQAAEADKDGNYDLGWLPFGTYLVSAVACDRENTGRVFAAAGVQLLVDKAETSADFAFAAGTGHVHFKLKGKPNRNHNSLPPASVSYGYVTISDEAGKTIPAPLASERLVEYGETIVHSLPAGRYRARVVWLGTQPAEAVEFAVRADETTVVEVDMKSAVRVLLGLKGDVDRDTIIYDHSLEFLDENDKVIPPVVIWHSKGDTPARGQVARLDIDTIPATARKIVLKVPGCEDLVIEIDGAAVGTKSVESELKPAK